MALEIERKFLVVDDSYKSLAQSKTDIIQGYLSTDPDRTVRIRICGQRAYLTIKSRNHGSVRGEWEYPIPLTDARELLHLAKNCLSKTRYMVGRWEIDEFHERHEGLVLAEIELKDPDELFVIPAFIGREVTDDPQYYNSVIASRGE
ncbi:MAG: CYTH domain-containing protein [Paramuribaculum sp.]|nr:CYTH domain-containing protein [Paramuribaculum sp.]